MSEDTNLIVLAGELSPLAIFTEEGGMAPILAKIKAKIDSFVPDMTTVKGRKEIASFAYKVVQSKTYLEGVGKKIADEQKLIPKKIDVARKLARDTLDAWAADVRKPLTDWEAAEAARVLKHDQAVHALLDWAIPAPSVSLDTLRVELAKAQAVVVGAECEEYEAAYADAKAKAIAGLTDAIAVRERYEADQAELASLRAAQAERDTKEAAKEAAHEAECREAAMAVLRERAAAAEAASAQAKIDSDAREAAEAELRVRREADAAAAKVAADAKARENNRAHKAAVNNEIVAALIAILHRPDGGSNLSTLAKAIVAAIAKGEIAHVAINY